MNRLNRKLSPQFFSAFLKNCGDSFLSFLAPVVILSAAFFLRGVVPFGENITVLTDFSQQYYPFLKDFRAALLSGRSLLWSNRFSGDVFSLYAYYAASPLNLLTVFVKEDALFSFITITVLLRAGFAGLCGGFFAEAAVNFRKRKIIQLPEVIAARIITGEITAEIAVAEIGAAPAVKAKILSD